MKIKQIENILLFLTILLIPTQLGKHFWPPFSYIYSLPIDYLSPTVYFWDLLVVVLIVIFIARRKKVNKVAFNIFLVFILSQLISLIPHTGNDLNLGAGLVRAQQYLIAGLFGVYIGSVKLSEIKSVIFWALGMAVTLETVLAVAQFFKGGTLGLWILGERTFSISTPAIAKFDFYGMEFLRPYATFPHPNVLAAFMLIAGILLKKKLTTFLAGLTILLTVSRTAMVAGFVAGLLLLTKRWKMVLVFLILILSPFLFTRFWSAFNYDILSFVRREQLSGIAWDIFSSSPIFGVGLNNFIPAASSQLLAGPSRFLQPVHNIFLLALAETGIVGLIGLIALVGYPVLRLIRLSPKPFTLNPLLLIWAMVIFLGMFDHYFLTLPQGYRLLFLIWGISFSMLELKA